MITVLFRTDIGYPVFFKYSRYYYYYYYYYYSSSKSNILCSTRWLTDSEVEGAQDLLKSQFPLVDGLEDPSIVGDLVTPAASAFVQIINTGSHWVCLSAISYPTGEVKV